MDSDALAQQVEEAKERALEAERIREVRGGVGLVGWSGGVELVRLSGGVVVKWKEVVE